MNRRGFIGTITALAGLALAKIKAPAAPDLLQTVTHPYWRRGTDHLAVHYTGTFEPYVQCVSPWIWDDDDLKHYAEFLARKKH